MLENREDQRDRPDLIGPFLNAGHAAQLVAGMRGAVDEITFGFSIAESEAAIELLGRNDDPVLVQICLILLGQLHA
ncbi:hypothetical protein Mapa_007557 [Marchantia paleacea]|nr:hypothetical protein Mapa_007557 [Marchantia paleacea]